MPSVSKKQHNFMAAVANNPKFAKKVGVKSSIGEEFMKSDKKRKFREGGLKEVDSDSNPGLSKLPTEVRNKMGYMKKGGDVKKKMRKFAEGGDTNSGEGKSSALKMLSEYMRSAPKSDLDKLRSDLKSTGRSAMSAGKTAVGSIPIVRGAKEVASRLRMPSSYEEEIGMKKGGEAKAMIKKEVEFMKKKGAPKSMIKHEMAEAKGMKKGGMACSPSAMKKTAGIEATKVVNKHEKKMHGMKKGGMAYAKGGQLSKADGCAVKGKSKGTMVKMKKGGYC